MMYEGEMYDFMSNLVSKEPWFKDLGLAWNQWARREENAYIQDLTGEDAARVVKPCFDDTQDILSDWDMQNWYLEGVYYDNELEWVFNSKESNERISVSCVHLYTNPREGVVIINDATYEGYFKPYTRKYVVERS